MSDRTWSERDLSRHLDGELSDAESATLEADLAADAPLRQRLARARRADDLALRAMLHPRSPDGAARPAIATMIGGVALARSLAAAMALTAIVVVARLALTPAQLNPGPLPRSADPTLAAHGAPRPGETLSTDDEWLRSKVRVVLSVSLPADWRERQAAAREAAQARLVTASSPSAVLSQLAARSESDSREDPSVPPLPSARPISSITQSARAAEALLDALPSAEQVRLAEAWAIAGLQRPVAFARLSELLHSKLDPAAAGAASRLADRPELAGWVASYGLTGGRSAPRGG